MLEDQQKINKFARLNSRWEEIREETKTKRAEIQTLEDASTDLMMLEDDEEKVPTVSIPFPLPPSSSLGSVVFPGSVPGRRGVRPDDAGRGAGGGGEEEGRAGGGSGGGLQEDGLAQVADVRPQDPPVRKVRLGHQPGGGRRSTVKGGNEKRNRIDLFFFYLW